MTAQVSRVSARHFQAYCPPCEDGINTHRRVKAEDWADKHNTEKHPPPKEEHT